ncbi:hypothetical protein BG262_02815 [Floricoccus penangensis]|uniref:Uncharacterized protein n=1 Tax=Floricoccus penangensis TaxID=1859475 RepID=A0A9Q5P0B4_9LACT|nr:hypothetical protein [Floricoccus penangensis]OFI46746.1 hypothetical protein BG262_02815 [Floricoccus penangensis]
MSLVFRTSGGRMAIPNTEMDKIQRKNLESIKHYKMEIEDVRNLATYDESVRFKNIFRENADGSKDYIISAEVVDELPTGSFVKRAYKALRVAPIDKKKLPIGSKYKYSIITVPSKDILAEFNMSLTTDEMREILEESIKKGVNYFG